MRLDRRSSWWPLPTALTLAWWFEPYAVWAEAIERPQVRVVGRQLLVDGRPFHMKGVNWNPVRRGGKHPQDVDFRGFVETDAEIMALAGINVVRTYETITDLSVLDALWRRNISLLNTVYANAERPVDTISAKVRAVMGHPAVLMWVVGNEWNYNGFYQHLAMHTARSLLKDAARLVRSVDGTRPIATVVGSLPDSETVQFLDNDIDIWGINQYEELSFGRLFEDFARLPTSKPMFLSEYGADAFDSRKGKPDEFAQAVATRRLSEEIVAATSQRPGGVCTGGLVFEFADEWWKSGHPATHDVAGAGQAAYGKVYPDQTFNEEWFGLVASDGTQRPAFRALAEIASPGCSAGSSASGCSRVPARASSGERLRACGAIEACAGHLGLCSLGPQGVCTPISASTTSTPTTTTTAAIAVGPATTSTIFGALDHSHGGFVADISGAGHLLRGETSTAQASGSSSLRQASWHGLPLFLKKFDSRQPWRLVARLGHRLPVGPIAFALIGLALLSSTCAVAAWRWVPYLRGAAPVAGAPRRRYLGVETEFDVVDSRHGSARELLDQRCQEP